LEDLLGGLPGVSRGSERVDDERPSQQEFRCYFNAMIARRDCATPEIDCNGYHCPG
jgi:hypothetical protein